MDSYKQTDRTSVQVSREVRKKLKLMEEYYDKPLNRVMRQIVNKEFSKLPKENKTEVAN